MAADPSWTTTRRPEASSRAGPAVTTASIDTSRSDVARATATGTGPGAPGAPGVPDGAGDGVGPEPCGFLVGTGVGVGVGLGIGWPTTTRSAVSRSHRR